MSRRRLRRRYGHSSTSMTWGVMPPYKEFVAHLREIDPDNDRPYLAAGELYPIEAHSGGADARALEKLRIEPSGVGGHGRNRYTLTEKQLYSVIKKLARMNMSNMRDEEMREEAGSLASGIMTTLGYEWI